jgi:hypothetical protein
MRERAAGFCFWATPGDIPVLLRATLESRPAKQPTAEQILALVEFLQQQRQSYIAIRFSLGF